MYKNGKTDTDTQRFAVGRECKPSVNLHVRNNFMRLLRLQDGWQKSQQSGVRFPKHHCYHRVQLT